MSFKNLVPTFLIIILSFMIVSPITWAEDNKKRYITVTGYGKISAVPDAAWVSGWVHISIATPRLTANTSIWMSYSPMVGMNMHRASDLRAEEA